MKKCVQSNNTDIKKNFTLYGNITGINKCKAALNKYYLSNQIFFAKCPGNNEDIFNKDNDNGKECTKKCNKDPNKNF